MSRPMIVKESTGAGLLSQPLRETSLDQLKTLFLRSESSVRAVPVAAQLLGLELETFPYDVNDALRPVEHPEIAQLLDSLGRTNEFSREYEADGVLVGLRGEGQSISLEPGGQIEFASRPYHSLNGLRNALMNFARDLREVGSERRIGFWTLGHHPFASRESMPKMPKERYRVMRSYLRDSGARGLDMMHRTCSVQCAVDFADEADMTRKVRAAARISPFIAALSASSPFSQGALNGFKSLRYQIWLETDEPRSGLWPEMLDEEGLTLERYVRRAMRTPAMFFLRENDLRQKEYRPAQPKAYEVYAESGFEGSVVTVSDFVDHLTTMFPEIRIKGYVELRGADCVPPKLALAIAAFWRGILDNPDACRAATERLSRLGYEDLRTLQPEIARLGLSATSPVGSAAEIAEWLVRLSHESLTRSAPESAECVEPLLERAIDARSVADDLIARAERSSVAEALKLCQI